MKHPTAPMRTATRVAAAIAVTFTAAAFALAEERSMDGSGNNLDHPTWGQRQTRLRRAAGYAYADGVSAPGGSKRAGTRFISNTCGAQPDNRLSARNLSDLHTLWGQFIDHDIDHTTDPGPAVVHIPVPAGDPWFDPAGEGDRTILLKRSVFDPASGTGPGNPREQFNMITSWIDASLVYGSDPFRATALRAFDGTGRLLTGPDDQMPYNTMNLANGNSSALPGDQLFVSGDLRTNENCQLIALHTVFLREHNRLCAEIAAAHPGWTDEQIYQRARRIVGAFMQVVTFQEYLPALLGEDAIPPYAGYDPEIDPRIANEFSAAAFRFGHSQVNEIMLRLTDDGSVHPAGHRNSRDTFFAPHVYMEAPPGAWLKGAAHMVSQEVDLRLVASLRNFLFGMPGTQFAIDLFAMNTMRGREHGLADLNTVRAAYGLRPHRSFGSISKDPGIQAELAAAYATPSDIDLWVGGLAEDLLPGAAVGPTFHAIIRDQFLRLRDGDRFWFENDPAFTEADREMIRGTTLADIIVRNTELTHLPEQVFFAPDGYQPLLADLTLDGTVGTDDLFMLFDNWGDVAVWQNDPRADFNGDGRIDMQDMLYLLARWTPGG
ncbi:MAG: hypothetical protein KF817_13085 [Phycisphaeraceae bacterium]|nr:hypothetical protein [Phycisphaeraceae bacterium]